MDKVKLHKGLRVGYRHVYGGVLAVEDDKDGKLYGYNLDSEDKERYDLTNTDLISILNKIVLREKGEEFFNNLDKKVYEKQLSDKGYELLLRNRGILTEFKEDELVGYNKNIYYVLKDITVCSFDDDYRGEQFVYITDGVEVYGVKTKEVCKEESLDFARIVMDKLSTDEGRLEGLQLMRNKEVSKNVSTLEVKEVVKDLKTLEEYAIKYIEQRTQPARIIDVEGMPVGGNDEYNPISKYVYTVKDNNIYIYDNVSSGGTGTWEGVRVGIEELQDGILRIINNVEGEEEREVDMYMCLEMLAQADYFSTKIFKA